MLSGNQVALAYLVASVFFILALKGLSSPLTSRRGNLFGMIGMAIAVLVTLTLTKNWLIIVGGIVLGGAIGAVVARKVQMTAMPELVAFMHSLVGMAAVLIAIAAVNNPLAFGIVKAAGDAIPMGNKLELFIGTFRWRNDLLRLGDCVPETLRPHERRPHRVWRPAHGQSRLGRCHGGLRAVVFFASPGTNWTAFIAMTAIAFVLGFHDHRSHRRR